eukprot:1488783-Rhodomonas_salina.5
MYGAGSDEIPLDLRELPSIVGVQVSLPQLSTAHETAPYCSSVQRRTVAQYRTLEHGRPSQAFRYANPIAAYPSSVPHIR